MGIVDLVVVALAVNGAVEIWHHSSIMVRWRSRLEVRQDWVGALSRCPWCLSFWVAWFLSAFYVYSFDTRRLQIDSVWQQFYAGQVLTYITVLAAARLANLINDVGHSWCRTPRSNKGEGIAEN